MRRSLFALSVLAAACAATPFAAAEPADAAVQVRAVWGPEQFPIGEVAAEVAPCTGGAPAVVTTAADGTATFRGGAGCYQVKVATPTGCSLDGDATQQVTAVPGITPTATFRFRCA